MVDLLEIHALFEEIAGFPSDAALDDLLELGDLFFLD